MERGRAFDIQPAGMLALDVARIEAGLLLIEVDFNSSKKALIDDQKYSPFEMGLGRLVQSRQGAICWPAALLIEKERGADKQIVGLEINWPEVECNLRTSGFAAGCFADCFAGGGADFR